MSHFSINVLKCCLVLLLVCPSNLFSQQLNNSKNYNPRFGTEVRGKNAITFALGTTVLDGDYDVERLYEFSAHIGYKRFLGRFLSVHILFHKFNLGYEKVLNEGYMSLDANIEFLPFPKRIFTPFVFVGGGYSASNHFTRTNTKAQGGVGFEILLTPTIGVSLFGEYNHAFSDELDLRATGASNDMFWRAAIGMNIYFEKRGRKKKLKKDTRTIIKSNPIIQQLN